MATVTKPIALDESLHTTEQTSRNLADVLAQALQMLNTTISGLNFINAVVVAELPSVGISTTTIYLVPSDDPQSENIYDEYINLDGTSAGWEKIGSTEIDLSNYYTKTETDTLLTGKVDKEVGKGLSTNDYTDTEKAKLAGIESGAEVNVQSDWNQTDNTADDFIKNKPSSEVKSATDTFTTVNGGLLEECIIELEPIQDLHGYDSPWVGGAGKNKLPLVLADIKSANTSGWSWSGNKATSTNGFTVDVLVDDADNVIGFGLGGGISTPSTGYTSFILSPFTFENGIGYKLNGIANGSESTYRYNIQGVGNYTSGDNSITGDGSSHNVRLQFYNGATSIDSVTVYPMLRLSTESDPTFEPYSNICPISGHTEVDLYNVGKNKYDNSTSTVGKSLNSSGNIYNNSDGITSDYISVSEGNYVLSAISGYGSTIGKRIYGYDSNQLPISALAYNTDAYNVGTKYSIPFTVPSGVEYIRFSIHKDDTDIQVETGQTATTYEPYLGHLYQVQIGSTVYGGYVDLVSGVMTVNKVRVDLGSLTWDITETSASGIYRLYTNVINDIKPPATTTSVTNAISDCYKSVAVNDVVSANEVGISVSLSKRINVHDTNYDTASSLSGFRTFINGKFFCYELDTPFTIQLTPQQIETLFGQNNLSTPLDGQSIDSVKYREVFVFDDVEKVVNLRVPISMLGTDESGRTTASQAYASGDYFYKDGYMCKAITSISAGATLTLNTNYSQGTLADVLKAIENA